MHYEYCREFWCGLQRRFENWRGCDLCRRESHKKWAVCICIGMGVLPDTQNGGLRMRQGRRERLSRHWLQRKLLVNDPGMHHGTCVTHVPWCMSGSLNRGGGENVPGACATRNFTYLARGPLNILAFPYIHVCCILTMKCMEWNEVMCTSICYFVWCERTSFSNVNVAGGPIFVRD